VTSPVVEGGHVTFRVPDPADELAGVRLAADRGVPVPRDRFARAGADWMLRLPVPPLRRFEYALELEHRDGDSARTVDPANPRTAPGAFGDKSVVELPGYTPPAWIEADGVEGRTAELTVTATALAAEAAVTLWSPADAADGEPLPLLVAHDGPEYDRLALLTRHAASAIAAGALPRHRVALLAPGERDEWYSAGALYARAFATRILPAITGAVATRATVGMGASLGALAMLHAQRRYPDALAGLFLQSGSFFQPRFDAQESGFPRYRRIVRFVRACLRGAAPSPVPVALTCGALEENAHNNRVMAAALAAQGYPVALHLLADLHNYTAWRDALEPHLTALLATVWGQAA
jgi:enterochelin esterase-like enzyme